MLGSRMRSRCAAIVCSGGGRFCTSFRRSMTLAWNFAMRRFPSLTSCSDQGLSLACRLKNLRRAIRCSREAV